MINVTKPYLPPFNEYMDYLKGVWDRNWLTNSGPLVNELELKLKEYLNLQHLLFLSNGTVAIQIAIKALDLKGEIITTPFSYVATTSTIVWEGCKPVFVDIDKDSFNIDPKKIESAITEHTSAILATHVYGNPCNVEEIEEIANKHKLKVIYDAAHAFGTKYKGKSVFEFGDISTTSFHATKIFHTVEGGAVITKDKELLKRMALLRNFGHLSAETFGDIGINGKNSELHAAMGLCNLKYIDGILKRRKEQFMYYGEILKGLNVIKLKPHKNAEHNFSYYPIVFSSTEQTEKSIEILNLHNIFPRRYFKPSLNELHYVDSYECPISENYAQNVLCLPLYFDLSKEEQDMIARLLLRVQNN